MFLYIIYPANAFKPINCSSDLNILAQIIHKFLMDYPGKEYYRSFSAVPASEGFCLITMTECI
jgi:hypothetical protein